MAWDRRSDINAPLPGLPYLLLGCRERLLCSRQLQRQALCLGLAPGSQLLQAGHLLLRLLNGASELLCLLGPLCQLGLAVGKRSLQAWRGRQGVCTGGQAEVKG